MASSTSFNYCPLLLWQAAEAVKAAWLFAEEENQRQLGYEV